MGFAKGSGYGTVFIHGEFAGFFGFIGVDVSFEIEADVDVLPEGGFFSCFPVAFDDHAEVLYFLSLFVENGDDIDAAATAQAHEEQLHRADAKVFAARFGAAVCADGVACCVCGFETEIPVDPIQLYAYH